MADTQAPVEITTSPAGITRVAFTVSQVLEEVVIARFGEAVGGVVAATANPRMIITFKGVDHLSSTALSELIKIRSRIMAKGGQLRLSDIQPQILEVFRITRLDSMFQIHATEDAATKSIR